MKSKYIGKKASYKGGVIEILDYKTVSEGAKTDQFYVTFIVEGKFVAKKGQVFTLARQTVRRLIKTNLVET